MSGSCGRGRFRPGGWRTLLLSLCLLAEACAEPSADGFGGTAGDEAVVRLTISLPQAELPVGRERAATRSEEAENLISTVQVLVLRKWTAGICTGICPKENVCRLPVVRLRSKPS